MALDPRLVGARGSERAVGWVYSIVRLVPGGLAITLAVCTAEWPHACNAFPKIEYDTVMLAY